MCVFNFGIDFDFFISFCDLLLQGILLVWFRHLYFICYFFKFYFLYLYSSDYPVTGIICTAVKKYILLNYFENFYQYIHCAQFYELGCTICINRFAELDFLIPIERFYRLICWNWSNNFLIDLLNSICWYRFNHLYWSLISIQQFLSIGVVGCRLPVCFILVKSSDWTSSLLNSQLTCKDGYSLTINFIVKQT